MRARDAMSAAGKYLRKAEHGYYLHWCPGCNEAHAIAVEKPAPNGAQWSFDGNLDAPTFHPSVNVRWGKNVDPNFVDEEPGDSGVCHYFVKAGHIEFCGDSTHALAGQKVPLPEWPA